METQPPSVLPPLGHLSRNERYADLPKFIAYLQGINSQSQIACLHLYDDFSGCDYSITLQYHRDSRRKSNKAAETLDKHVDIKTLKEEDFINVVRTYFCKTHDFTMNSGQRDSKDHFLKLWEKATAELRIEVWNALRKCERIYPPRSTPQKKRPGLDRATNSVPKEVSTASETRTPSSDPVEPPTRPSTVQGNLTEDYKSLLSNFDATPSRPSRAPTRSNMSTTTKSNDMDFCVASTRPFSLASPIQMRTSDHPKTPFSGRASQRATEHTSDGDLSSRPHIGPEAAIPNLPDSFRGKDSASETQQSPSATDKVKGPGKTVEPTVVELRLSSAKLTNYEHTSAFNATSNESPNAHKNPEPFLKGSGPSTQNRPKNCENNKVPESEARQPAWHDTKPAVASKSPFCLPERDNYSCSQAVFMPLQGESTFNRLAKPATKSRSYTPESVPNTPENGTPKSDPITSLPKQFPSFGDLQDTSTPTAVPHAESVNDQTPIVSVEQNTERASSVDVGDGGAHLEDLSAAMEGMNIASPSPNTPLAQKLSRSRARSPLPQGAPRDSCKFALRDAPLTAIQIKKILQKDLEGHIYVLEARKFFKTQFGPSRDGGEEWCKIGIAGDVNARVRQISTACGIKDLKAAYSTPRYRYDVLGVIEDVCHEQLHNFRRYMDCGQHGRAKCKTKHDEWFAVSKVTAVETVKMWEPFLDNNPYGNGGVLVDKWSDSLRRDYTTPKHGEGDEQDESLHQGLEAWIKRTIGTVEGGTSKHSGCESIRDP